MLASFKYSAALSLAHLFPFPSISSSRVSPARDFISLTLHRSSGIRVIGQREDESAVRCRRHRRVNILSRHSRLPSSGFADHSAKPELQTEALPRPRLADLPPAQIPREVP